MTRHINVLVYITKEARKDMLGYELQVINNSGKMSCVKIFIKKKYIENAKMV